MRYTINATTAVRTFSELLNEIKYKGTVYTIERSGKPIAELSPVSSPAGKRTLSELPGILEALPKLGDDARTFAGDIERIRKKQPQVPKGGCVGLIFDTTELIRLERDAGIIQGLISEAGDVPFGISIITVSELLHGVERAASNAVRVRRQAFVEGVLDQFPILPFDMPAARVHARIWASLAAQGEMIGAHDLIIAATAISLDYEVVTSTMRDFTKVDGLRVRKG